MVRITPIPDGLRHCGEGDLAHDLGGDVGDEEICWQMCLGVDGEAEDGWNTEIGYDDGF